jgi:coenzyme F420-0:L-glutamate ligase/coenzyme F420-1:gamma-L-glutamate ligase
MNDYDTLLKVIRERRSIRRFADRPVSREDVKRLIEAARWAPSNHNRQPWRFVVLDEAERIQMLARKVQPEVEARLSALPVVASAHAAEFERHALFFAKAPVVLIVMHRQPINAAAAVLEGLKNGELVSGEPLSAAMAVENLLLAAHALGLGACVLTAPLLAPMAFRQVLAIPAGYDLTCVVALGYPAETPTAPRRKELDQILLFSQHAEKHPCA